MKMKEIVKFIYKYSLSLEEHQMLYVIMKNAQKDPRDIFKDPRDKNLDQRIVDQYARFIDSFIHEMNIE